MFSVLLLVLSTACQNNLKDKPSAGVNPPRENKAFENKNNNFCKPVFSLAKVNQYKIANKISEKSLFFDYDKFSFYHSSLADSCQSGFSHIYYVPQLNAVGMAKYIPNTDEAEKYMKVQVPIQWKIPDVELQKKWAQAFGANSEMFETNSAFLPLVEQPIPQWVYGDGVEIQKPALFFDSYGTAIIEFKVLKSEGLRASNFLNRLNKGQQDLKLVTGEFWENKKTPINVIHLIGQKSDYAQSISFHSFAFAKKLLSDLWEKNKERPELLIKLQNIINESLRFENSSDVEREFNPIYVEFYEKLWIPKGPSSSNVSESFRFYIDSLYFIKSKKPESIASSYLRQFLFLQEIYESEALSLNESIRLKDELDLSNLQFDGLVQAFNKLKKIDQNKMSFTNKDLWRETLNLVSEEGKENIDYINNRASIVVWMINSGVSWNDALVFSRENKTVKVDLEQIESLTQWLTINSAGPQVSMTIAQNYLKDWFFVNNWKTEKLELIKQSIEWLVRMNIFLGEASINKANLWAHSELFNNTKFVQIKDWFLYIANGVSESKNYSKVLAVSEEFENRMGAASLNDNLYGFISWMLTTSLSAEIVDDEFMLFYSSEKPLEYYLLIKESYSTLISSKGFGQNEELAYRLMKDWILNQNLFTYQDGLKLLKESYLWLTHIIEKGDALTRCQIYLFQKKMDLDKFAKLQKAFDAKKTETPNDLPKALKAAEDSVLKSH